MIQRRVPSENINTIDCTLTRPGIITSKYNIKERKAAKRKEKSRVAAQIRRNKESQTLILLQNALPLSLPSPNQMLEKSIVIRIAGQTLFLMNTLDQVLGMDGWLTIPLISNNFLTFFVDSFGQIVYASPNIQLLLEQHHWSNLIGMSISDVIEFKARWPTAGEVVRLKLSSNPSIPIDSTSFLLSSTNSQSNSSRTAIASRLNLRKNFQPWNYNSSTCSLFNVWCYSNINHTNAKLRLLILQAVQIKSSVLRNINNQSDSKSHVILSKNSSMPIERSVSWPPMISHVMKDQASLISVQNMFDDDHHDPNSFQSYYQQMISSAHDRYYNFKSASTEFCQLLEESPKTCVNLNLLDIIHLEDIIKVKSILDLIIKNNESYVWTPIYRIMGKNGQQYMVKTLAKQYSTTSTHSLILNHLLIKTSQLRGHYNSSNTFECSKKYALRGETISLRSINNNGTKTIKSELSTSRPYSKSSTNLKRKSSDKTRTISCEKYARLSRRALTGPLVLSNIRQGKDEPVEPTKKTNLDQKCYETKIKNEILSNDPFLPMDFESHKMYNVKSHSDVIRCFENPNQKRLKFHNFKTHLTLDENFNHIFNRSPSYSLESCVLTSPGSESTDIPMDDQFVWDLPNSFQELMPLNSWLDEQYQNDLALILPI